MPAALTTPWRPPKCDTASSTAACTSASLVTSAFTKPARSPSVCAVARPTSSLTSSSSTLPPAPRIASAAARPSPEAPPVVMNVFPSIRIDVSVPIVRLAA